MVDLPVNAEGRLDVERQRVIAAAAARFDTVRQKLQELGEWSGQVRIASGCRPEDQ